MTTVTLRQGRYSGITKGTTRIFHGIPYAQPFTKRFQLPQPTDDSDEGFAAVELANNCPQLPSRLAFINGKWHPSTKYDEQHCAILSIYSPEVNGSEGPRPVIVWIHGGAFLTGGSQLRNYDATLFAQDSEAVVVTINYRLGAFGFLYDEKRSLDDETPELPAGMADVVAAFEWVHANIHAFGGDNSNVTSLGQSAGAYLTQTLLSIRPDLLHKAIIQSSPAGLVNAPSDAAKTYRDFAASIPPGTTTENVPVDAFLQAQGKATGANSHLLTPWGPTSSTAPGFGKQDGKAHGKHILIGWTATDGLAFLHMASPQTSISDLDDSFTDKHFRLPSIAMAEKWRSEGNAVTTFELNWAPEDYRSVLHIVSIYPWFLALMLGQSPRCVPRRIEVSGTSRGQRWRKLLGQFAADGSPIKTEDGIEVF